jgi:uncharacterized protein (TIGR03437 family)
MREIGFCLMDSRNTFVPTGLYKGPDFFQLLQSFRLQEVFKLDGHLYPWHDDFSLVTTSKPAAPGEILSLFVTGLGPVSPGVNPGQPFPSSPLAIVNSPVQVTVNGNPAQVTAATGYPGAVNGYQVNFQVPPTTAKGPATVQISAAWIAGAPVTIPIQ